MELNTNKNITYFIAYLSDKILSSNQRKGKVTNRRAKSNLHANIDNTEYDEPTKQMPKSQQASTFM